MRKIQDRAKSQASSIIWKVALKIYGQAMLLLKLKHHLWLNREGTYDGQLLRGETLGLKYHITFPKSPFLLLFRNISPAENLSLIGFSLLSGELYFFFTHNSLIIICKAVHMKYAIVCAKSIQKSSTHAERRLSLSPSLWYAENSLLIPCTLNIERNIGKLWEGVRRKRKRWYMTIFAHTKQTGNVQQQFVGKPGYYRK